MSIVLLYGYSGVEDREMVPVAAQATFRNYWKPACELLGLEWILSFETGAFVEVERVGEVVCEFRKFRDWVEGRSGWSEDDKARVVARVEAVVSGLEAAAKIPDVEIWIG